MAAQEHQVTDFDQGKRYASHWTAQENSQTPVSLAEIEKVREQRKKDYHEIAKDYYDLTTDNLEFGWGPRFHFCPFPKLGESIDAAMSRHDHFLALMMGLKPGMRGLDCGCGTGGPSREISLFSGAHITGISINEIHIERATAYAKNEGLSDLCDYKLGDFMKIPFPDNHFDFVYSTEATVYAPNLADCYTEIARVLKPGGVFATYEWLMTRKFSPTNAVHVEIRQRIERGDGVVNMLTIPEGLAAYEATGLELYHSEDMAERGPRDKQWWYCIDGDTAKTTNWEDWWLVFRLKPGFFRFAYNFTWFMEKLGLTPRKGMLEALRTQGMSVYGMRDGGREGIFTTSFMMVGRKPEGWKHPKGQVGSLAEVVHGLEDETAK